MLDALHLNTTQLASGHQLQASSPQGRGRGANTVAGSATLVKPDDTRVVANLCHCVALRDARDTAIAHHAAAAPPHAQLLLADAVQPPGGPFGRIVREVL